MAVFVSASIAAAPAQGVQAQRSLPQYEARIATLYQEAYNNYKNERGLALADSVRRMAEAAGDAEEVMKAMIIPIKYECQKTDNLENVVRRTDELMSYAQKHGSVTFFYSAVSHRVTYLINHSRYTEAMEYQRKMLDYAQKHGHAYGMAIGHISLGNFYRKRLRMVNAIDEYRQALNVYSRYGMRHDLGIDYKRIVECYIIMGHFDKAVNVCDEGLANTSMPTFVSGLYGYKAFAEFMLGRDRDFFEAYSRYMSYESAMPDVDPFVGKCIEVMKLIYDGCDDAVQERLKKSGMGAYKTYVEIAYYKRKGQYDKALRAMRKINISLYGDSRGVFTTEWAQTSADVNNNLAEIDRQKAANVNSQLELVSTNLELRSTQLELSTARDAERLALMAAEAKRLSYNNQKLLSRQLRDSLNTQLLRQKAREQDVKSGRITFLTLLGVISAILVIAYYYLKRNIKTARELKHTNRNLCKTLADLRVANDQAQESDRKKTQFIQNMSHEVRTPLNAIVGFSQVLTDQEDTLGEEERANMVQIINNNSEMLNTLVNDILDLTSIESGRYAMKKNQVCVNWLCHMALDATRSRKSDGVHLRLETELPDDFSVCTDGDRVQQVLENLLSNALKNTSQGSVTLSCSLCERPGMLTFTVTDTGIGVPRDKQEAIFERFCKLDQFKQGAGLGLEICRTIAVKLVGNVGIDHDYTGGARFWFFVPVA